MLALVGARLAIRQRRWDDATELEAGLTLAREIGLPYVEALLLSEYGRLERVRGESDQARTRLEEALAIFRRLGAGPDVEQTERALAEI
jgi:hypothetical protein